jgi:hypothetical protein
MTKIYRVKRFAQFPNRKGNDRVMKEFGSLKQAQLYSIGLNEKYASRFYVEEISLNPNESAKS